ncbi:MAG TPA: hypothetical protein VMQ86_20670, partial [Bryobacteraceae bacterium]|nr:hypothetical protein [Bryobacteraceae bacterium]
MEERRGGSVADRIAAVEFFFAIGTLEALRVILGTGIMAQGSPLRSTAQAAAGLAAWLAQSDADAVVEELFGVCEIREIGTKRMLAIAGLQSLADRHLIPPSAVARLGLVAQDPSLPSYAIAAAIWATSCYPEASQLPDFVAFLRRHISRSESYLDVRFQCFQSLVRLGMWQEQEETFLDTLDLVGHSRLLPSKPDGYQAWQALLLTQLAIRVPEKFLDAVIDVIDKAGADAVHAVLQVCTRTRDPLGRLLDSVASAAIARALRVFNLFYAETDTLSLV